MHGNDDALCQPLPKEELKDPLRTNRNANLSIHDEELEFEVQKYFHQENKVSKENISSSTYQDIDLLFDFEINFDRLLPSPSSSDTCSPYEDLTKISQSCALTDLASNLPNSESDDEGLPLLEDTDLLQVLGIPESSDLQFVCGGLGMKNPYWKKGRKRLVSPRTMFDKSDEEEIARPLLDNDENPSRFNCRLCRKSFRTQNYLQRHFLECHSDGKRFLCLFCGKGFNKTLNLEVHSTMHTGERPYKCNLCDKTFTHKTHMDTHKRLHTGVRPFKCDTCKKYFKRNHDFSTHMRSHTGERPYKCDVCEKTFTHSQSLKKHVRTHTGVRPYKCDICEKAFAQRSHLETHGRMHTGERPYKCNICEKSFTQRSILKKHRQRMHELRHSSV